MLTLGQKRALIRDSAFNLETWLCRGVYLSTRGLGQQTPPAWGRRLWSLVGGGPPLLCKHVYPRYENCSTLLTTNVLQLAGAYPESRSGKRVKAVTVPNTPGRCLPCTSTPRLSWEGPRPQEMVTGGSESGCKAEICRTMCVAKCGAILRLKKSAVTFGNLIFVPTLLSAFSFGKSAFLCGVPGQLSQAQEAASAFSGPV